MRPLAMTAVAVIGCATALFAATIALVQTDIKKVLAYSTISQLGYMFLACGVGAFGAGIFHLMTHAFFKALLFLGAGSVMHAMGGEQDMRRMGGLRKGHPVDLRHACWPRRWRSPARPASPASSARTRSCWRRATAPTRTRCSTGSGVLTAGLTSFYMFRLLFLTFHGAPRYDRARDARRTNRPRTCWCRWWCWRFLSVAGGLVGRAASVWRRRIISSVFSVPVFRSAAKSPAVSEPKRHRTAQPRCLARP